MFNRIGAMAVSLVFAVNWVCLSGTMNELDVSQGYGEVNSLQFPVFDATQVQAISVSEFKEEFDRSTDVIRKTGRTGGGGLKSRISEEVKIGSIFSQILKDECTKMGFTSGDHGWKIGGTIKDFFLENNAVFMAVLECYGYMRIEVEITDPQGETTKVDFDLYSYSSHGGSKFRLRHAALAYQLIDAAQETISKLNSSYFHAPAHPNLLVAMGQLGGRELDEAIVHAVGLSGMAEAVPRLSEMLKAEKDESYRTRIVDALARLGSPLVVPALAERYSTEDNDVQWFILKAFAYIGTQEAMAQLEMKGSQESDRYHQKVAQRLIANHGD